MQNAQLKSKRRSRMKIPSLLVMSHFVYLYTLVLLVYGLFRLDFQIKSYRDFRCFLYQAFSHLVSETPLVAVVGDAKKVLPVLMDCFLILSKDISHKEIIYSVLIVLSGILTDKNGKECLLISLRISFISEKFIAIACANNVLIDSYGFSYLLYLAYFYVFIFKVALRRRKQLAFGSYLNNLEELHRLPTLYLLKIFICDARRQEAIIENAPMVIRRLIELTSYPYVMVIRETAIQCLGAMSELPHARIYPMRTQVLQAITKALDDPKRVVRLEAVKCRLAWIAWISRLATTFICCILANGGVRHGLSISIWGSDLQRRGGRPRVFGSCSSINVLANGTSTQPTNHIRLV
ncbi:hypothetical protein H5410_019023 [Solanum commersonii]|uniref:MMS19 nucleotide excision repair protein n=1 Tax=Solanum commersonii TaxID=4109 RepID=A0A9J6A533_SOLCO|nr:hypothetical protein H5410_019023 [Solanum commersonii]